jgi:hypothetical protein
MPPFFRCPHGFPQFCHKLKSMRCAFFQFAVKLRRVTTTLLSNHLCHKFLDSRRIRNFLARKTYEGTYQIHLVSTPNLSQMQETLLWKFFRWICRVSTDFTSFCFHSQLERVIAGFQRTQPQCNHQSCERVLRGLQPVLWLLGEELLIVMLRPRMRPSSTAAGWISALGSFVRVTCASWASTLSPQEHPRMHSVTSHKAHTIFSIGLCIRPAPL